MRVRDGQSVKAGDVLIELDPTMTEAGQERQKSDLLAAELDVARLAALKVATADRQLRPTSPHGIVIMNIRSLDLSDLTA
jgi:hemolysin D